MSKKLVTGARVRQVLVVLVMMMLASLPSAAPLHAIAYDRRRHRLSFRVMVSVPCFALDGCWASLFVCGWEEVVGKAMMRWTRKPGSLFLLSVCFAVRICHEQGLLYAPSTNTLRAPTWLGLQSWLGVDMCVRAVMCGQEERERVQRLVACCMNGMCDD